MSFIRYYRRPAGLYAAILLSVYCSHAASNPRKLHEISSADGRTIHARIEYVGERDVFLRTLKNQIHRYPLENLSGESQVLIGQWKKEFNRTVGSEQLIRLSRVGVPKSTTVQPVILEPEYSSPWKPAADFSDEFNSSTIDENKWNIRLRPWGERVWSADNLRLKRGRLLIQARYDPHTDKRGRRYFYKLGILQSQKKTTYGYFEARIRACSRFPGLCPAFWLYSNGRDTNPDYPNVTYSEIDIVELLQGNFSAGRKSTGPNHIDLNLHTREIIDGKETWRRPQHWPEVCKNTWEAPWDPRDGFHLYACENTPEKITWYIDGIKVAESPNNNWHLPMNVTLTMELRPPFIRWAGEDGREPVPEAATPKGFPTHMEVDYVRCWTR